MERKALGFIYYTKDIVANDIEIFPNYGAISIDLKSATTHGFRNQDIAVR